MSIHLRSVLALVGVVCFGVVAAGCSVQTNSPVTARLGYVDSDPQDSAEEAVGQQRAQYGLDTDRQVLDEIRSAGDGHANTIRWFLAPSEFDSFGGDEWDLVVSELQALDGLNSAPMDGLHGAIGVVSGPMELTAVFWVEDPEAFTVQNKQTIGRFSRSEVRRVTWTSDEVAAAHTDLISKGLGPDGDGVARVWNRSGGLWVQANPGHAQGVVLDEIGAYSRMIVYYSDYAGIDWRLADRSEIN